MIEWKKEGKIRYSNEIVQRINNMHGTNVNDWIVASYVSVERQSNNHPIINDDSSHRYM